MRRGGAGRRGYRRARSGGSCDLRAGVFFVIEGGTVGGIDDGHEVEHAGNGGVEDTDVADARVGSGLRGADPTGDEADDAGEELADVGGLFEDGMDDVAVGGGEDGGIDDVDATDEATEREEGEDGEADGEAARELAEQEVTGAGDEPGDDGNDGGGDSKTAAAGHQAYFSFWGEGG